METFSLKVRMDFLKNIHKHWIRKSKYTTYIRILGYNFELGFKCELIKLYPDHYNKTITYLKPSCFKNYEMCSFIDYFDIENKIYIYESNLKEYKNELFKKIFK